MILVKVYIYHNVQTSAQLFYNRILRVVELDLYGETLHHFYEVTAGVIRRQQGETCAGGRGERGYMRIQVFFREGVHMHFYFLTDLHPVQLCFFEVSYYPQ